ncbi:hypothetical protein LQZ18_04170, partial [Lachnospiraceae bacterium ZAX-1]
MVGYKYNVYLNGKIAGKGLGIQKVADLIGIREKNVSKYVNERLTTKSGYSIRHAQEEPAENGKPKGSNEWMKNFDKEW